MTNYYENLDVILTEYRLSYLNQYNKGDYLGCAQLLYTRNSAHPPEAYLTDMPKFVLRSNSLRARLQVSEKAKAYCDYWNPRLEMAMATFRNNNQDQYNQI